MAVTVVQVVQRTSVLGISPASSIVLRQDNTLEVDSVANVVEVARPGGTVANVSYGTTPPLNPQEGQIWIDIS